MSRPVRALGWGLLALLLSACPGRAQPTTSEGTATPPSHADVDATPPDPADQSGAEPADGTLASVEGKRGRIEVVQQAGRRILLIDGVVQGVSPIDGAMAQQDALVELVTGSHPGPGKAIVIGLGTGATATALAAKGYDVEVADLEPEVIALARRWFGYEGHAEAADGLAYVEARSEKVRVIVVDAFDRRDSPAHLLDNAALETYRDHLSDDGVLAIRMLGRPLEAERQAQLEGIGRSFHFAHLLGGGIGDEPQNLYIVASDAGINLVAPKGLPMRPLWMNRGPGLDVLGAEANRLEVAIAGYVILTDEDGRVAVDLAHPEMGAVRFLVSGAAEALLRPLVSRTKGFPTVGDIGSDGPTKGTLVDLAGGGFAKRSDVRMSPVVAAVKGRARVVAVVHPDTVFGGRPLGNGGTPLADGLPYGGVLYELEDVEVGWTITTAQWAKLERGPLRKVATKARRAIGKGDTEAAVAALDEWLAMVSSRLGPEATVLHGVAQVASVRDHLARAGEVGAAAACRDAADALPAWSTTATTTPLAKALLACADR